MSGSKKKTRYSAKKKFLIILRLVLILALAGYIIFLAIKLISSSVTPAQTLPSEHSSSLSSGEGEKQPPQTVEPQSQTAEPQDDNPTPSEPEPEPEPEPEKTTPAASLRESDGCTYLTVAGEEMLLVNKQYSIPESFGGVDSTAAAALEQMYSAAAADGISLFTVSGYRSYADQESIHNGWIATYGSDYAKKISAEPGHSEHQTGMAFDINSLSDSFENTSEFAWLNAHCAEYGFIMRYPKGKSWATGYNYEPWHYRYVGTTIAKAITDSGLSVEEYAGLVSE